MEVSQQELVDQVTTVQKELLEKSAEQKEELEADKVGRQALALMLDEVAIKLRGTDWALPELLEYPGINMRT